MSISICGCKPKWDPQQFDDVIQRLDRWIVAVNTATGKISVESELWRDESSRWRNALDKLEGDLKKDAQDVLANEVRNISSALASDIGDQVKTTMDYLEVKLKDNLKALRDAIQKARADVIAARGTKDSKGIKLALDELSQIRIFHDPVVTGFIPSHVQLLWADNAQTNCSLRVPLVEVRGWGFERPAGEEARFSLKVIDNTGKELRELPRSAIFFTTRYLMQLKLDTQGVVFGKNDHGLVFAIGSASEDNRSLPINHVVPSPSPPEPPTPAPIPPPPLPADIAGILFDDGDRIRFVIESTNKLNETTFVLNRTDNVTGFWKALVVKNEIGDLGKIVIKDNDRIKEMTFTAGSMQGNLKISFGKHGLFGAWRGITEQPILKDEVIGKRITYTWEND